MQQETWRDRLRAALKDKGRSMRGVSLAAGHGHGYVQSLLKDEKDPGSDNLVDVCNELGISLYWLLYGIEAEPDTEELLHIIQSADPDDRAAALTLLRRKAS